MTPSRKFVVNQGWIGLLQQLGAQPATVLQLAGLPADLFARKQASLSTDAYYRLWRAMEQVFDDPTFAISLVKGLGVEVFDPPIFAAYCSPNLNVALQRLRRFKPLIGPVSLHVDIQPKMTTAEIQFHDSELTPPSALIGAELGFFVQLARMATGRGVVPQQVISPCPLPNIHAYSDFFGVTPSHGDSLTLRFAAADANAPFVSENTQMWDFFEPALRKRLADVANQDSMTERVKAALRELLPSGQTGINHLAGTLLVSRRTLQRRLGDEGTHFQALLNQVREELARYYIDQSDLPYTQIAFLLGYDDPNSFFRAFQAWTGSTPDAVRNGATH